MENVQMKPMNEENKGNSAVPLIVLAVLGLLFIYLVGQKTQLTCTRADGNVVNCQIKSVWMGKVTVSSREASGVRNAFVDSDYDDEENSTTYRVVLTTNGKDVPVTRAYSSGNINKNELANDINAFIKNQSRTEADFSYKSAGGIISAIVVGVFFVVLSIPIFKARSK